MRRSHLPFLSLVTLGMSATLTACGGDAAEPPAACVVSVAPTSATLTVGGSTQLSASIKDSQGNALSGRTVTWQSADPAVASVSANGLVSALAAGGPVSVRATCEGSSASAQVTIVAAVASVAVTPATSELRIGGTVQLTAAVKDDHGNNLTGRTITWQSSAPAVASVSAAGLVTGVAEAANAVTISATAEGMSGNAQITVVGPVAAVSVTPDTAVVSAGHGVQLMARTYDTFGRQLTFRTVTWSSSDEQIATVTGGNVTGVAGGLATITATSEGVSGTAQVRILPVLSLSLPSGDGLLDAKLYQAASAGTHPTLVFLPRYEADTDDWDLAMAAQLEGWNVLLFNFRGTAASTGLFSWANAMADSHNLLALLRAPAAAQDWGVATDRVIIGGNGVGGGIAFLVGAQDPLTSCVVGLGPGNLGKAGQVMRDDPGWLDKGIEVLRAPTTGTSPKVRLEGTVEQLAQYLIDHADELDIAITAAPLLAGRQVLLFSSSAREDDPAYAQAPLRNALTAAGASVTAFTFTTDVLFSDKRAELAEDLVAWLLGPCGS